WIVADSGKGRLGRWCTRRRCRWRRRHHARRYGERVSRVDWGIGFDGQSCINSLSGIPRLDTDPEFIRSRAAVDFGSEIGNRRYHVQFLDGRSLICFGSDDLRLGLLTILPKNKCWLDFE